MSRICSCGQDLDQSFDSNIYRCGCECRHTYMKWCWSHNCEQRYRFMLEYKRERGYRWEHEIKLTDKETRYES